VPFKPLPYQQAFPMMEWGLNWCISNHAHQYLILHSAVVEKNGIAVILPAPPGSGKSTLCAGLVNRGWRLLSDELGLISLKNLELVPLARPVNLKNESIEVIKQFAPQATFTREFADTNKGTVALMQAPTTSVARSEELVKPACIIIPVYTPGAATHLEHESKGNMFMHVADSAFNYSLLGLTGFETLVKLIDRCDCYTFTYSNLQEATITFDELANTNSSAC
jgi:HprK-related kinase A